RELEILITLHTHRTNQIARLRTLAATNTFPCQISVERLKKGRLWGWNHNVEVVECKDAAAIIAATNSICSVEMTAAENEVRSSKALSDSLASLSEKLAMGEKLCEICDKSAALIAEGALPAQDELLQKSLVEVLKGAKK
nr:hypothetical protein [Kiritimatiellia bacterium]